MPAKKKSELNAKQRKNYRRRKTDRVAAGTIVETPHGRSVIVNTTVTIGATTTPMTDKPETNALDDSWLHCNYSYRSAVRDDIDASDVLPATTTNPEPSFTT
ncbi:hypothetical protein PAHAL_9G319100 [Panicum hallii]|uniref:Uncharacterized protein n=1 Tax=Panicum hallii TaxID=206008 RepID=A0A2T8I367_9POAL|nr:hypothetical protein PAHAL_9G319100 [Panicum hallii]